MPHTMKKVLVLFLAVVCFASCKMKSTAESTPIIYFSYFVRSDSVHTDTLRVKEIDAKTLLLDTISVKDTVTFILGLNAVFNELDSLSASFPASRMEGVIGVKEEWFIKQKTDIVKGHFKFQPYMVEVPIPMQYIPTASGTDTLTFYLKSTTTVYNAVQRTIIQPVR